jgi:hypothetical protein
MCLDPLCQAGPFHRIQSRGQRIPQSLSVGLPGSGESNITIYGHYSSICSQACLETHYYHIRTLFIDL